MSGGYEVVLEAIDAASSAAKRAADGVRPVDLAGTLAGVPLGLPGGTAIEATRMLGDRWGQELPAWVKNMDEYAAQLASAVRRYRTDEQAAAHDLRAAGMARPV